MYQKLIKDYQLTKWQQHYFRIFCRFLKDENAYLEFKQIYNGKQIKELCYNIKNKQIIDFVRFRFWVIDWKINWFEIEVKWHIYIYNNKLYGTPKTCSKSTLLRHMSRYLKQEILKNDNIINEIVQILKNEKLYEKNL